MVTGQNKTGATRRRRRPSISSVWFRSGVSVDQAGTGGLFKGGGQRLVFRTILAADRADPVEVILGLIPVALFDLPQSVILPSPHMVRVGLQCPLIPDLRDLIVAELAVGVADQVGDVGTVLMAEHLQLLNGCGIILTVVDCRIGGAIAVEERRIIDRTVFAGLLFLVLAGLAVGGRR